MTETNTTPTATATAKVIELAVFRRERADDGEHECRECGECYELPTVETQAPEGMAYVTLLMSLEDARRMPLMGTTTVTLRP